MSTIDDDRAERLQGADRHREPRRRGELCRGAAPVGRARMRADHVGFEQRQRAACKPTTYRSASGTICISRFKKPDDPLKILVVCDMLLTGFDAPVEQVLYLDAPLREHTLLAGHRAREPHGGGQDLRARRRLLGRQPAHQRRLGPVFGRGRRIECAPSAHRENPASRKPPPRRHAPVRGRRSRRTKRCVWRCLEPDDVRAKFELDFLRFAEAMDMVLPDPKALEEPYVSDLKWLARLQGDRATGALSGTVRPEGLWREGRAKSSPGTCRRRRRTASGEARYPRSGVQAASRQPGVRGGQGR